MWSIKSIINKILGKKDEEVVIKNPELQSKPIIKDNKPKAISKPYPEKKPKEPKDSKLPKKSVEKPQAKLPKESSFEIKKANIEVVKKTKEVTADWKDQADAAEKIKSAFQGFFYDVASLENLNNPELKKSNFENFKINFRQKLDQNLPKLDLIDQQILQHISNNSLFYF